MQAIQLPPEIGGYIAELKEQILLLSDRAAGRTAELHAARSRIALLEGRVRNLERSGKAKGKKPASGNRRTHPAAPVNETADGGRSG